MALILTVNGNASGRDRVLAAVGERRFLAPVTVTNTGAEPVDVTLRMRDDSVARVRIGEPRLRIEPGAAAETTVQADTPSDAPDDTVLQALVGERVEAEFRLTAISLARESVFHNLVPRL
ncbi:MAG: hypothetical protein HY238_17610 [Acidobacteria bacterium]|nr:hypothetical protein [Acidobacteriota bacterium]